MARRACAGLVGLMAAALGAACQPASEPADVKAEAAMSTQQTMTCVETGVVAIGATAGGIYLTMTEGGLFLIPETGGASVPLAEGVATLLSAGVLVSGLATMAACSIDLGEIWQALTDAGATDEAKAVENAEADDPQAATCDSPQSDACCLEDDESEASAPSAAKDEGEDTSVANISRLDMPNASTNEGWVSATAYRVQTFDTETGTFVLRDYIFDASLRIIKSHKFLGFGIGAKDTLLVDHIFVRPRSQSFGAGMTYRYRPGVRAMKKLIDTVTRAVAAESPSEVTTLRVKRERKTEGYSGKRCRQKVYDVDSLRQR